MRETGSAATEYCAPPAPLRCFTFRLIERRSQVEGGREGRQARRLPEPASLQEQQATCRRHYTTEESRPLTMAGNGGGRQVAARTTPRGRHSTAFPSASESVVRFPGMAMRAAYAVACMFIR